MIGGGFSGLTAAYFLVKRGFKVDLYEKSNRVGGLIGSQKNDYGIIESAANALIANQELELMCQDLGIVLVSLQDTAKKRFIYYKGKPRRWPLDLFSTFSIFIFLLRFFVNKLGLKPYDYESLEQWGYRTIGKNATHRLLSPAFQGIYATEASNLSAKLTLAALFENKPIKGKLKGSVAPEFGMGQVIKALKDFLQNHKCNIHNCSDSFSVQMEAGLRGSPMVLATDLESAKGILERIGDSRLSLVRPLQSLSLTSLTLQLEKPKKFKFQGFGCLFPRKSGVHAIGVLFNSFTFPNRVNNTHSETWILNDEELKVSELPKDKVLELVRMDRERVLQEKELNLLNYSVHQWPQRIPLYSLQMEDLLQKLDPYANNVFLTGNYLGQLSLSRIILRSKQLAEEVEKRGVW